MALPFDPAQLQKDALSIAPGDAFAQILDAVDLTPAMLKGVFNEVGKSPERFRALLKLWLTPWFKPTYLPDQEYAVASLRDIEFLGIPDLPPAQLPYRMLDIESGNLVEFPAIGARGQYCMLSHRWKGVELTLDYIKEARKKEFERSKTARSDRNGSKHSSKKSDVKLVLEQCRLDIEEQENLIRELYGATSDHVIIGELLSRRFKVRAAGANLGQAEDNEDKTRTKLRFAEMERKIFSDLIGHIEVKVEEKEMEHRENRVSPEEMTLKQGGRNDVGSEVVKEMEDAFKEARATLQAAQTKYEEAENDIKYFQERSQLRNAIDEMVCRLQRWKSAIKLEQAIRQAKDIFKTKLFQYREKCYLWTDTCCINKENGSELSESLSLMGDWYAAAEYTLVQLDTSFREADAVKDWYRFDSERREEGRLMGSGNPEPNFVSFEEVYKEYFGESKPEDSKPEWSTRAWTLQELVMSKTTFYVNSEWALLSRPVESLGYFYHLIPFIALYTRGDTRNIYHSPSTTTRGFWDAGALRGILDNHKTLEDLAQLREHIERSHTGATAEPSRVGATAEGEAIRVERAQHLIALLRALGVRIPGNMNLETATSEMTRAVYLASAHLACPDEGNASKRELLTRLQESLNPELTSVSTSLAEEKEKRAQNAINFVLQCLVAETEELILADRKYVAEFGQIQQLEKWQKGTCRSGFSAQSVLELCGKRVATVETDRSYALMGILGVRFPTFHAEGSAKALARLLDEVVIARNDVSVFNWTGMEMGSPIRGRSMYPCSLAAYGNQEDRSKRYNLLLSERVQGEMDDVMKTYESVIHTLSNTIGLFKDKEHRSIPLGWIERIVKLVQSMSFEQLKPQSKAFGQIIEYIREQWSENLQGMANIELRSAGSVASPTQVIQGLLRRQTTSSEQSTLSRSASSIPFSGRITSLLAKETENSESSKKSKLSGFIGRGKLLAPRLSGNRAPDSAVETDAELTEGPAGPHCPGPADVSPATDAPAQHEGLQTTPAAPSWQDIDEKVISYLDDAANEKINGLPLEIEAVKFCPPEDEGPSAHRCSRHPSREQQDLDTISPNPIVVNNSGIEGFFDIQRVIVTMIDPEKLRRQIAKAASPQNRISGWCSISTGFARVVTNFACERQILEKELDAVESVEARVLQEQEKDEDEKRRTKLRRNINVTLSRAGKTLHKTPEHPDTDGAEKTGGNEAGGDNGLGNTEEERLINRMIAFIQEPHLQLVAGEWVLARFSGAPGASWFLCHLELGPQPGQFYGHRIATGAIDFNGATPELGLMNAWKTYMDRKKRTMCCILDDYIKSRTCAVHMDAKVKAGLTLAQRTLDGFGGFKLNVLNSSGAGASAAEAAAVVGDGGKGKEAETERRGDDESGSEGEGSDSLLNEIMEHGTQAAKSLGQLAVLAMIEKLFEMRADHLDKTLATAVLKRTPRNLRTAVENINDNKSFLPAMFHSSTRVHMF